MENTPENLNYVINMKNKQELLETIVCHSYFIAKEFFKIKDEDSDDVWDALEKKFQRYSEVSIKNRLFDEYILIREIKYFLTRRKFIEKTDDIHCQPREDDE